MWNVSWLLSPVTEVGFWHLRESGYDHQLLIYPGGTAPAKTVTSLLIIPSVLALGILLNCPDGTSLSLFLF